MKWLAKALVKVAGWQVKDELPTGLRKCVMVGAPHTSNWDAFFGICATRIWGCNFKFIAKKEAFFFPMGLLLKFFGGFPIDRSRKQNTVEQAVELFDRHADFFLGITPEGTRSYRAEWKKGFYHIAVGAKVPILLPYIDYEKKELGLGPLINPSGDIDADIEQMMAFFRTKKGKYPEKGVR